MNIFFLIKNLHRPDKIGTAMQETIKTKANRVIASQEIKPSIKEKAKLCLTNIDKNKYDEIFPSAARDMLLGLIVANLLTIPLALLLGVISPAISAGLLAIYLIGVFPISLVGPIRVALLLTVHLNKDFKNPNRGFKDYLKRVIYSLPLGLNYVGWVGFYQSFLDYPEVISTIYHSTRLSVENSKLVKTFKR